MMRVSSMSVMFNLVVEVVLEYFAQDVEGEVGVPQVAVVVDCGSAHVPIEPLVFGLSEELFFLICKAVPKFQTCAVGGLCGPLPETPALSPLL